MEQHTSLGGTVARIWQQDAIPSLSELIAIPAVSPAFDVDWSTSGHLDAAVSHMRDWIDARGIANAQIEVVRLAGRSPLLMVDIPPNKPSTETGTALLYGHLDRQPPMDGWSDGLEPWKATIKEGRLYGRGGADDSYAGYAAVTAVEALRTHDAPHSRCVVLLETGEESGSPDLPAYLEHLAGYLGEVTLVVCLDSGAGDYDRMWLTTSLRGGVQLEITARVLDSGLHSGTASGVVPSSFRVLRQLLDRLEDSATGKLKLPELWVEIPENRVVETRQAVHAAPGLVTEATPLADGVKPVEADEVELALNSTWRPTLSVIGADGLPKPADAGNVLRAFTTLSLSFRLPPTADPLAAVTAIRAALSVDVPYNAEISFGHEEAMPGWNAPETAPWLRNALDEASDQVFGTPWRTMGLGGSIPFMGLLQRAYPKAQFVVTGALGPGCNPHVPDESLPIDYAGQVTTAVAYILTAHANQ